MEEIIFNHDEMLSYIYDFNVVEHKYKTEEGSSEYNKFLNYENIHKPTNLEKHGYSDLIDNTAIIYGDSRKASEYSMLYKKVLDKFVIQYLGIPGLSSLYNEHYMDFEWNMHSNLNFKNHTNSYYRDHFIHEIRNLFMMFRFFEDQYIYNSVENALFSPKFSKISEYATHQLRLWLDNIPHAQNELFDSLEHKHSNQSYFKRYVIFSSTILACLFHDVGYPVSYYFSIKDRILDFIPSFHALISDSNFDFNYVNSVLEESVLFQVVGKEEIKQRFEENDHGAISAILMGIYFYKTGKIHALPVEQKTAIEIGVLAIYNHTLDFAFCDENKASSSYYKMQFSLNPISYMLRICDDMQEWDREYFEIKAISNLLFCPKCLTPLRRTALSYSDYLKANNIPVNLNDNINAKEKCYEYWCLCGKSFTKKDDFTRRKLMNIKACNEVIVHLDDSLYNYIEISFNYDNFKLLRLCTLQLTFTKYRCNEIKKLKKFVERQSFINNDNKGYKGIFIKHNLTPNPMLLKMFILRDFLNRLKNDDSVEDQNSPLNVYKDIKECYINLLQYNLKDEKILDKLENLSKQLIAVFFKEKDLEYINVIVQNCNFYLLLLMYEYYVLTNSDKDKVMFYRDWLEKQLGLKKDDLRYIIYMDAVEQIKKTYKDHEFEQIGTDYYNSYLKAKSKTYLDIEYYCDDDNELNKNDNESVKSTILSYYTDLYLYNKINEITNLLATKKNK